MAGPSAIQRYWLATLARDYAGGGNALVPITSDGLHNTLLREQRTFDALERRGWAVYRRREDGYTINGYQITDAGRAALSPGAHHE